ncbi:hypothetical protein D3C72_1463090 [compost metagenome]
MLHEVRGQDVDVVLVHLQAGVVGGHGLHALVPVRHGDGDAVRLGGRGQVLLGPFLGQFEREFQDAVHADAAHHGLLDHDFALGAREHAPADARILALGVLAHHVEVDIARLAAGQRALDAGHQAHRAQVYVLVERAAELEQRAPQGHVVRDLLGPAHGAEVDGVVLDQRVEPVVRQHLAVTGVVVAAGKIEVIPLEVDAEAARRGVHHAYALGHDFRADSVSGNHGDLVLAHSSLGRYEQMAGAARGPERAWQRPERAG